MEKIVEGRVGLITTVMSRLIHIPSLCWCFLKPTTSSHVKFRTSLTFLHLCFMPGMSPAPSSSRSLNLELIVKSVLVRCSFSFSLRRLTLYRCLLVVTLEFLFNFSFTLVITRWWSEATPAPLLARTSWRNLLNFLLMQMWPIWFSVELSGDAQVTLFFLLGAKMLPPMTRPFKAQKSVKLLRSDPWVWFPRKLRVSFVEWWNFLGLHNCFICHRGECHWLD